MRSVLYPQLGVQRWAWLAGLAVLLGALAWTAPALAHGGGKPQLTGAPAGPYRVYAWTSPEPWRVGLAHTSVAVTLAADDGQETPVSGAQVAVVYTGSNGQVERIAAVEQTGAQTGFYEAEADLAAAGSWSVQVEVSGPAGTGVASFSDEVLAAESFNWWLVGAGVLAVLLVVGYVGTRQRSGSKRRGGAASGQQPADVPVATQPDQVPASKQVAQ